MAGLWAAKAAAVASAEEAGSRAAEAENWKVAATDSGARCERLALTLAATCEELDEERAAQQAARNELGGATMTECKASVKESNRLLAVAEEEAATAESGHTFATAILVAELRHAELSAAVSNRRALVRIPGATCILDGRSLAGG